MDLVKLAEYINFIISRIQGSDIMFLQDEGLTTIVMQNKYFD